MTQVLITGANGHIGAHTVREVLARGHQVRAFVREGSDQSVLDGVNVPLVYGDVLDRATLVKTAQGCDVIIHMAAVYRTWAKNIDEIMQPAVEGTRNMFFAAKEAGIKRVVYTSSAAAIGPSKTPDRMRTPADWYDDAQNLYTVAKRESERIAWKLAEEYSIPMVGLNPPGVLGSLDYKITPTTRFIEGLIEGSSTTFKGGLNEVDVRDVAFVHAAAIEQGTPGQRYIVGGENKFVTEWGQIVTDLTGIKTRHSNAPRALVHVVGSINDWIGSLRGKEPSLSWSLASEFIERYQFLDCSVTYQTFGYQPRDAVTTIAGCVDWLLQINALKPDVAAKVKAYRAQKAIA
jgi:dihydroflavonol-4-reductase